MLAVPAAVVTLHCRGVGALPQFSAHPVLVVYAVIALIAQQAFAFRERLWFGQRTRSNWEFLNLLNLLVPATDAPFQLQIRRRLCTLISELRDACLEPDVATGPETFEFAGYTVRTAHVHNDSLRFSGCCDISG